MDSDAPLGLNEATAQIREKGHALAEAAAQHWDREHMDRAISEWEWALGALERSVAAAAA